jgi:hypothetical protein
MRIKLYEEFNREPIPGDVLPHLQLHVFDFDDTLAVSNNSTAIALFDNGEPVHKSRPDVLQWIDDLGLNTKDLLKGPDGKFVEEMPDTKIWTAYVKSGALVKVKKQFDNKFVTGSGEIPKQGPTLVLDYTPSSYIGRAKPIHPVIDRLKREKEAGATTVVMTARQGEGDGISMDGKKVHHSNARDVKAYLKAHGAEPDKVYGVAGKNKAETIKDEFLGKGNDPEEIHFYDDDPKNIEDVDKKLGGKVDAEVFTYGPGSFDKREADPIHPSGRFKKMRIKKPGK